MTSPINRLIPAVAERFFDDLIPQEAIFGWDYFKFYFTNESTKTDLAEFYLNFEVYCCDSNTEGGCFGEGTNDGGLFMFISMFEKVRKRWKTTHTSIVKYDSPNFVCVVNPQNNKCSGSYDSTTLDVDFYEAIEHLEVLSLSNEGSIIFTKLYPLIILNENPCFRNKGPIREGMSIITSLLS